MAFATKRKPPVTNKKRVAKHHKHSQHYLRQYHPFLPLLMLVIIAGLLLNLLWPTGVSVLGASSDLSSTSMLKQTNQLRANDGESPVGINPQLNQAAQAKALDMVAGNYWSHTTPDGTTPWSFIASAGYSYAKAGENLAYGFSGAKDVTAAWMHSPEHRANLLGADYTQVGFGVASSPDYVGQGAETVVVALYAEPTGPVTPAVSTGLSASGSAAQTTALIGAEPVSRLALLSNSRSMLVTGWVLGITALAAAVIIGRHARFLHQSLSSSEAFIVHHPYLDVILLVVIVAGSVASRTVGFIV